MTSVSLAQFSRRMATITLLLIILMLVLNAVVWLFPTLASKDGLGLGFALSDRQLSDMTSAAAVFPWWQTLGAIVLSSIPLIALAFGLKSLRRLFQCYATESIFPPKPPVIWARSGAPWRSGCCWIFFASRYSACGLRKMRPWASEW